MPKPFLTYIHTIIFSLERESRLQIYKRNRFNPIKIFLKFCQPPGSLRFSCKSGELPIAYLPKKIPYAISPDEIHQAWSLKNLLRKKETLSPNRVKQLLSGQPAGLFQPHERLYLQSKNRIINNKASTPKIHFPE